jgi:hypothetical protein
MTLNEKVQELQAINPPLDGGEINRRLQEWKNAGFLLDDQMEIKSNPLVEDVKDNLANLTRLCGCGSGCRVDRKFGITIRSWFIGFARIS